MTRDFERRGLVVNTRPDEYDGTTAVTRGEHLEPEEVEFMRWKAERWMKVRHMPAVFRHDPWFVLRNGSRMLAHTFRGTTWRSVFGLENDREVFQPLSRDPQPRARIPRLAGPALCYCGTFIRTRIRADGAGGGVMAPAPSRQAAAVCSRTCASTSRIGPRC